jgi:hypothetical protein
LESNEAPKEVTDDEMKEIVDTVIYKYLDDKSPDYTSESTRSLMSVVTSKLNEDNIDYDGKKKTLIQMIKLSFNVWEKNYTKKRRIQDSDPKSEQSDAKKPKYDTDQQMEDADSGSEESDETKKEPFKPVQLFFKRPDKKVEQSPISMMRNDPTKMKVLASWAHTASFEVWYPTGKNPTTKTVCKYIMENIWEKCKKGDPKLDLAAYEKEANDWNREHESFRNEKKAQKKKK